MPPYDFLEIGRRGRWHPRQRHAELTTLRRSGWTEDWQAIQDEEEALIHVPKDVQPMLWHCFVRGAKRTTSERSYS